MEYTRKVIKFGTGVCTTIPQEIVKNLDIKPGDTIIVHDDSFRTVKIPDVQPEIQQIEQQEDTERDNILDKVRRIIAK